MQISLIITTYNRPDALLLVLESIERQSKLPKQVIIADDGSNVKTSELISVFKSNSSFKLLHSFQIDEGFRAARSRNLAISKANSDYIILIDGDMILHQNFIHDHEKRAQTGYFVQGTRVLLSQNKTKSIFKTRDFVFNFLSQGLINRKNAIYSNFLSSIFSINKNYLRGIKTCNIAFYRKDFISVNGFNNKFEGWGREDSEFGVRLMNKGIKRKTLRFNAIQYHLWHPEDSREFLEENERLLERAIDEKLKWCKSGINEFL